MSSLYSEGYSAHPSESQRPGHQKPIHPQSARGLYRRHTAATSRDDTLWTTQNSGQSERELDIVRRKLRECEATIIHQAHIIRQSSHFKTQCGIICPDCNQEVSHTCTPPRISDPQFQSRSSYGCPQIQKYQARTISRIPRLKGLKLACSPIVNSTDDNPPLAQYRELEQSQIGTADLQIPSPHFGADHPPSSGVVVASPDSEDLSDLSVTHTLSELPRLTVSGSSAPTSFSTDIGDAPSHLNRPDWSIEYNPECDGMFEMNLARTIRDGRGAYRVKFSPDGRLLAVIARYSQVVTIYDATTGTKVSLLQDLYVKESGSSTAQLSFSIDGEYLAICTLYPENIIRVWKIGKKHVRNTLKGHTRGICSLDFSPDGRFLISGSIDLTVRIWNMRDGSSRIFYNIGSTIWFVRFSQDGVHLAFGTTSGMVFICELRSCRLVASFKAHSHGVTSIVFMPNGEGLITSSWDNTSKYWDITSARLSGETRHGADDAGLKETLIFIGHLDMIYVSSISPDGQWFASGSHDGSVRIWNTNTGKQQCILQGHMNVFSVAFSPAGGLATACPNGVVRIWKHSGFGCDSIKRLRSGK